MNTVMVHEKTVLRLAASSLGNRFQRRDPAVRKMMIGMDNTRNALY